MLSIKDLNNFNNPEVFKKILKEKLSKKKDVNKSDAILIARFFSETGFKDDLK